MRAKRFVFPFLIAVSGTFILIYGNACTSPTGTVSGNIICPSGNCQPGVQVQSITPSGGPLTSGQTVIVGGTGFSNGATVKVGNLVCAVTQVTPTSISCTLPAATAPMWADVIVESNGQAYSLAKAYAFGAVVLGQPDFSTRSLALGNSLAQPWGGLSVNGSVFIADSQNSRINVYKNGITSSGQTPDWVLGQTDLSNGAIPYSNQNAPAETFGNPRALCYDGTKLMVLDQSRNRLVIYAGVPTAWSTAPSVVLGQTDFNGTLSNQGYPSPLDASMMSGPQSLFCDGNYIVVSDTGNNRVLVWSNTPGLTTGQAADYVIGQSTTNGSLPNQGNPTPAANTLSGPTGLFYDGAVFYVADSGNHRILGWNGYPTSGSSAHMELGQADFLHNSLNGCNATTMTDPYGVARLGNYLFATDRTLHRLMAWDLTSAGGVTTWTTNSATQTNLGQPSGTSCIANQATSGPVSLSGFRSPVGLFVANNSLFVSDSGNNRVLAFTSSTLGASGALNATPVADFFLGQATGQGANPDYPVLSGSSFRSPQLSSVINGSLYIPDAVFNRVLVFNPVPTSNNAAATSVLGQPDFLTAISNTVSNTLSAQTLAGVRAVFGDPANYIYVADSGNNRTLIFNNLTGTNDPSAAAVIGETSFTISNTPSNPSGLRAPGNGCLSGTTFYQTDTNNNRILVYPNWSAASPTSPSNVIGQNDQTTGLPNGPGGGSATANGLWTPAAISCDNNNHLIVADEGNHRVLIFNLPLAYPAPNASLVLGQPDFVSNAPNYYLDASSTYQSGIQPTASGMYSPRFAIVGDNGKLYVADSRNNRILIWNTFSSVQTAQPADGVFGQSSMTQYFPNAGAATPTSHSLVGPSSISVYSGRLIISDGGNARVLIVPEM